ncbi:leucine-rich repeat extensin-like protein [Gracilaria domingensis]|nr:leucine-rich repeat extensin-like protein [Gracilaria domingensis]
MVQPAVVALFQQAVLYQWCSRPSFLNGAGKLDRPDPWHIWDTIESEMDRLLKTQHAIGLTPFQSPSDASHRSAHIPATSTSATAETPQSPVLSELNASNPIHVVEAKMLPVPSTVNTHSSERSSSPEQLSTTIRRLSSTMNALSSDTRKLPNDTDANDVIALPHILEQVFSTPAVTSLEPRQPQSPPSKDAHLQSSSWYDRPDTELHASEGKLHQFNAEHTAPSEAVAWDRLQLLGRIQGSQSSLQSSASSDHRSPEPQLTSPEKPEAKFSTSTYVLNDEYASSETDAISIKDMRDTHESDEHQYSQLFARVSALERQSTNRSFRSLLNAESQGPSSGDFREPLEGSNTSLGSDVVDSLVRKARSVRTSDSNLMTQLREGISFPSIRIEEEGGQLEAGVFDILKELSDHLNMQERRNSGKSLKSTAVRPVSYLADSKLDGGTLSLERKSSVENGPLTSMSFRNVPRVGLRDYAAPSNEPMPVRRDRTTKGIVPELGATQPSTKSMASLASEDTLLVSRMQQSQSDVARHAASLQSEGSSDSRTPLVDVDSLRTSADKRPEIQIHDEYEAYDEFLVAEYEVEERVEEHQSGTSKTGAQRDRPLSVGPHHLWVDEEREDLRPIKSETSPLDKALGNFSGTRRTEGGVRGAFGRLRKSVRYEDGDRPRRLDSLRAMVFGRSRTSGVQDGTDRPDVLRLASGPVLSTGVDDSVAGGGETVVDETAGGRYGEGEGVGGHGEHGGVFAVEVESKMTFLCGGGLFGRFVVGRGRAHSADVSQNLASAAGSDRAEANLFRAADVG